MADPDPPYVDLADQASDETPVVGFVEDEEEPHSQTDSNYAVFLSGMVSHIENHLQRTESFLQRTSGGGGGGRDGDGKRRRVESQETAAFDVGESSQSSQWNPNEIDGLFCPICLEAWTNDGDHCICCLPCGHIFGMSCIKKWLVQRQRDGKCPQCNAKCKLKNVRRLFASRVISVGEESQKRIRSLEAKCVSFEKERLEWHKREAELLIVQDALQRTLQQLTEGKHLVLTSADKIAASNWRRSCV